MFVFSGQSQASGRAHLSTAHQLAGRNHPRPPFQDPNAGDPFESDPLYRDRVEVNDEYRQEALAALNRITVVLGVAVGSFLSVMALPSPYGYVGAGLCIGGGVLAAMLEDK